MARDGGFSAPPAWITGPAIRARNGLGRLHDAVAPPEALVLERLFAFIEAKALGAAAELGVADALADGPLTNAALAARTGTDADALGRLLRLLVPAGFFGRTRDGRWVNNAASESLRSDAEQSMRDWCLFFGSDWFGDIWNHAADSIRTGGSATEPALGRPFFDFLADTPAAGEVFSAAMAETSSLMGPLLTQAHDFSGYRRICDVGGGTGNVLASILEANPGVSGVVYELPEVAEAAAESLAKRGLAGRCDAVGGDFFESVPGGCDMYLMQAVTHDWSDADCDRLLASLRAAVPDDGRVCVVDFVMPDDDRRTPAKHTDLLMLVLTGSGRERTLGEFRELFARSRFRLVGSKVLPTTHRILEFVPI